MVTQSKIDCKKELIQNYDLDDGTNGFTYIWGLHYAHESGKPFEKELKNNIKEVFPDANQEELYKLIITYFEDAKRRRKFFQRGGLEGYGYEVLERDNGTFKLKLRTYNREKAKAYLEALKLEEFAVTQYTTEEVPPSKALVIKDQNRKLKIKLQKPKGSNFGKETNKILYKENKSKEILTEANLTM